MTAWLPCANKFIPADVVRWTEALWEERKRKAVQVGRRRVVAELLAEERDWLRLLVRSCEVLEDRSDGRKQTALCEGAEIRRKRATIDKGEPERLPWSDEDARARVVADRLPPRPKRKSGKRR